MRVTSGTPENADGKLKPSSPEETGTTPGTNWKGRRLRAKADSLTRVTSRKTKVGRH